MLLSMHVDITYEDISKYLGYQERYYNLREIRDLAKTDVTAAETAWHNMLVQHNMSIRPLTGKYSKNLFILGPYNKSYSAFIVTIDSYVP